MLTQLSPAIPSIWRDVQHCSLAESHLTCPCLLHGGEGSSFPGLAPPNDIVNSESMVAIKASDSGVMIGYQVDKFTNTWSTKCFVALLHNYHGFLGKVLRLTYFLLEPGCKDYSCLDQEVEEYEHGLDSILTGSVKAPEPDASFDEAYTMPSSVSSGFLCLVITILIFLNCKLSSAGIKSHKL